MDAHELDLRAQALYDECPTVKPAWSQLGETTRSVWRDRAVAESRNSSTVAPDPVAKKVALPESMSLF